MKSKLCSTLLIAAGLFAGAAQLAAAEPRVIKISGSLALQFDVTAITASPGEDLKVVFTSTVPPAMPKAAMGHNFVLLAKGTDVQQFLGAATAAGVANDYIPAAFKAQVLANTKLLGGGETAEVVFKAPMEAGEYTFVCSFTGHAAMKGILTVTAAAKK